MLSIVRGSLRDAFEGVVVSLLHCATRTLEASVNGLTPKMKGFGNAGMNSFNHYACGAIEQWVVERVAGLAPDPSVPGYKHFFVRPLIGGPLDFVRAELETPYGKAPSVWTLKNKQVVMDIVVPPNTTATVEFPDGRKDETVGAGTYRYKLSVK